jgi:type I restriction enzyme M protein
MPNSAANSTHGQDAATRKAMVDAGVVEALVALPPGLFPTTAIPVTVWLLGTPDGQRQGEVLFIDATRHGEMSGRTRRVLTSKDIDSITGVYRAWRAGEFSAVEEFAASATVADIVLPESHTDESPQAR